MSGTSEPQPRLVLENFIGGKFVACKSHMDSYNPSTGEVYCSVPDSGPEEVGQQCLPSQSAKGWKSTILASFFSVHFVLLY